MECHHPLDHRQSDKINSNLEPIIIITIIIPVTVTVANIAAAAAIFPMVSGNPSDYENFGLITSNLFSKIHLC